MALGTVLEEFVNVITWRVDDKQLDKAQRKMEATLNKMDRMGKRLTLFVSLPIKLAGIAALKTASDFEQLDIAFTTMLRSAEKAKILRKDLLDLAKTTPFKIHEVMSGAKQLLAVGFEQKDIINTLTDLGNVAAGLNVPISRLILNMGQVKTQGKLTGRELRDFAVAGVPVLEELANSLGKSKSEIVDLVSAGEISFEMVAQAFRNMSGEGGRFANLMEKQSKTLGGAWSNLMDTISIFAAQIGDLYAEDVKKLTQALSRLFDKISKIDKRLLKFATSFALLIAAIGPLMIALPFLVSIGTTVLTFFGILTTTVTSAGVAVTGFNIAVATLPILIALAAGALALLIDEIYVWVKGGDSLLGRMLGPWKAFSKYLADEFGVNAVKEFGKELINFFELGLPHAIKTTIFFIDEVFKSMQKFGMSLANFVKGKGFKADLGQKITTENTTPASASAIGGNNSNTNINQSNKINVAVTVPEGTSNSDAIDIVSNGVQNALNPNGFNFALTATSGLE